MRLRLVEDATGEAIAGAIVEVQRIHQGGGAHQQSSAAPVYTELLASDDTGRIALALPPGRYRIAISAPWLVSKQLDLRISQLANSETVVRVEALDAEAIGETIEVVEVAPVALGQTSVTAETARTLPGGGDALKIVQALPGVARPPTGSANLIIWGAAPRDTRVFVDGVPVPSLYHFGGYRAAMGNEFIAAVALAPAGFGPQRGSAIGGIIEVTQKRANDAAPLVLTADPLDIGAATRSKFGKSAIAAAARYSVLGPAVRAIVDEDRLGANVPLPTWFDGQLRSDTQLGATTIAAWVMGASDALQKKLPATDPARVVSDARSQRMIRASIRVTKQAADHATEAQLWAGWQHARTDLAFGTVFAHTADRGYVAGGRIEERGRLAKHHQLTTGLDLDVAWTRLVRQGSLSIPAREGDPRIFGQPPGDDTAFDAWRAQTANLAAYGQLVSAWPRVATELGVRAETWVLGVSRQTPKLGATPAIGYQEVTTTLSPRLSVRVAAGRWHGQPVWLRIDAGRYLQARLPSDTSAVFGSPTLGREQAYHAVLGVQLAVRRLRLEASAYARLLSDLVMRDPAPTPLLAQALTQDGVGRAAGLQVTARWLRWHGVEGWVSYGLARAQRRDTPTAAWRLFDYDQTHNLTAVAQYQRGRWSVGGRARVATGEPRTDVVGAYFDSRTGRYQPIRGEQNAVRLPTFFALDARVQYQRAIPWPRGQLTVFAEVQNLTHRANAEELVYNGDFSERAYLTGLPLLALAGVRFER